SCRPNRGRLPACQTGKPCRRPAEGTSDAQDTEIATYRVVTHPSANAPADGVEQGLANPGIKFPVHGRGAKKIGKGLTVERLHSRVPANDCRTEQFTGILDQSPTLIGHAHVLL